VQEVVVAAVFPAMSWTIGEIVALDGQTGALEWRNVENPGDQSFGSQGRTTPVLADVTGDQTPEVIYAGRHLNGQGSIIYAVDGTDGSVVWSSHTAGNQPVRIYGNNGALLAVNLDNDDQSEIVLGRAIMDHDGRVVVGAGQDGLEGTNGSYTGGIAVAADLTADEYPEIITGARAWTVNWQPGPTVMLNLFWDSGRPDGYPAVADLDLDGDPEVVLTSEGEITVLNAFTGALWCGVDETDLQCQGNQNLRTQPIAIPGGGLGGPPTIADFDGDGRPEIGVAGGSSYSVYDLYRDGEDVVTPMGFPNPTPGDIYVRWTSATQDQSSNSTGSSVFDFQGNGGAEVGYGDECYLRVYDGSDGSVLLEQESSSATIHEYPIVVDVDSDGNSEMIVVSNDFEGDECTDPGYAPRRGVFVYGDANDLWVPTRRVWTQHSYHVTNATSAGTTPPEETNNWDVEGLNNYRQNAQGEGIFNAPDLSVDIAYSIVECPEELLIQVTVRNVGTLGVLAGVTVDLYEGTDINGTLIDSVLTMDPLLPGAQEKITFAVADPPLGDALDYFVAVDGGDDANGVISECEDGNNGATVLATCPLPG
jgi:hypothetical protein